jgi:hypothetical protein
VELIGRPYAIRPSTDSRAVVLGRIGLPQRLSLPAEERLLGIVGDRAVTARAVGSDSVVSLWSFSSGAQVAGAVVEDRLLTGYGFTAGSFVIAETSGLPEGVVGGITAISTTDGTVRPLLPDTSSGLPGAFRVLAAEANEARIATSICASGIDFVGNCTPASVIDVETGRVLEPLEVDGGQVIGLAQDGLLLFWGDHVAFRDLAGREIWTSDSYTGNRWLKDANLQPNGTVIIGVMIYGDSTKLRFFEIDGRSGESKAIATLTGHPLAIGWDSLSTDTLYAIVDGVPPCVLPGPPCGPGDGHVVDPATLDLVSGELTESAIHITFAE